MDSSQKKTEKGNLLFVAPDDSDCQHFSDSLSNLFFFFKLYSEIAVTPNTGFYIPRLKFQIITHFSVIVHIALKHHI